MTGYRRAWAHEDATIDALAIDSPGTVAWWQRPNVTLFNVMVHLLSETSRHAGHADILREQLDGAVGTDRQSAAALNHDAGHWVSWRARIERAAAAAAHKKA